MSVTMKLHIEEMELVSKNLSFLMKEQNVSKKRLSFYLGCTSQTLSNYLDCKTVMDVFTFSKLANFFNVSMDYFFENHDSNKIELEFFPIPFTGEII